MFSENLSQVERAYYKNLLLSNSERFIDDSERQKNIISVVIVKDSSSVVISTHEERMNQILNKMKKNGILYEKAPGLRDGTVQK